MILEAYNSVGESTYDNTHDEAMWFRQFKQRVTAEFIDSMLQSAMLGVLKTNTQLLDWSNNKVD